MEIRILKHSIGETERKNKTTFEKKITGRFRLVQLVYVRQLNKSLSSKLQSGYAIKQEETAALIVPWNKSATP